MRLGYLYSRYPVISQTFCDREMLAMERLGFDLEIGSIHPPLTSLRHEHIAQLSAPLRYAPPQKILSIRAAHARSRGHWPGKLVDLHERKYGAVVKAELRARNALYFADLFRDRGVEHCHVHFANRAAHTAMFLKELSGIPFSVTAHGQDFMADLGSDDLLREIFDAAEFIAAETDYSAELLRKRSPNAASKIHRVYNGIDLDRFPISSVAPPANSKPRIVSIGRLVAFKGFEHLIDACAELVGRGDDFICEIVGDGPLHHDLQRKIDSLGIGDRVALLGALSQDAVREKLNRSDLFVLASTVDQKGASDIFPTVIAEAMSAARPVVSTTVAGIPELVIDGETGLLGPPGDVSALTAAIRSMIRQPDLRVACGRAGRARIEQHFQIEQTIQPLVKLFERASPGKLSASPTGATISDEAAQVAYLIDRWPDPKLLHLESELEEMQKRNVPVIGLVCEFDWMARMSPPMKRLAESLEFLPDAMVIEAEWRSNRDLAQELEEGRATETERPPAGIFLRQARFALILRKMLTHKKISHIHATSSRTLVCTRILQQIVDLPISATIELHPELSSGWIKQALEKCVGGRVSDRKLLPPNSGSFLLDRSSSFRLTARTKLWQKWAQLLQQWSNRKSKIENRK